jgi:hypothetical protein
MTIRHILATIAAAVLIFASPEAFAEQADGIYSRHFMAGEVPLWDISGDYSDLEEALDFILNHDPSGALSGTGTFQVDDGEGTVLDGDVAIAGKVKSAGTARRVSMKFLITNGTGTFVDDDDISHIVTFTATIDTNSELDPISGELVLINGKANLKLYEPSTGRRGSVSEKFEPGGTLDLPVDATGEWDLTLNLVPDGSKKYDDTASTATVDTSTGGTADLTAKGSYASKTDTSKITLKRTGGSNLTLVISTVGSNMTVKSAKGKLYGQNIKFTAP